jgi:hypothetical protein
MNRELSPRRHPSGRKVTTRQPRHAGYNTIWRRFRDRAIKDDWEAMVRIGLDPVWGSVVGKLSLDGTLSEFEASAARLYGELRGKYDRYHGYANRDIPSPSYQRGLAGGDDEIERHTKNGTILDFEKKAKKARKAWDKATSCIPMGARNIVDEVCLYDREVPSLYHEDLKIIFGNIAKRFGFTVAATKRRRMPKRTDTENRVHNAIEALDRWFKNQKAEAKSFILHQSSIGERGVLAFGVDKRKNMLRHAVVINPGKNVPAVLDALFLKAAGEKGWAEGTTDVGNNK